MPQMRFAVSFQIGEYPTKVPIYQQRIDHYSNHHVTRGAILALPKGSNKMSLHEFNKKFQCPLFQPDLDGKNGVMSFLKLIPPTKHIVEMMCAYAESQCKLEEVGWRVCREKLWEYKNGSYPANFWEDRNGFEQYKLYRVIGGELYFDWPWGRSRLGEEMELEYSSPVGLMKRTLDLIHASDIGDSVFWYGGETPSLPWSHPFPIFSCAPGFDYNHIPWPWMEGLQAEEYIYGSVYSEENENTFNDIKNITKQLTWDKRVPSAAFIASFDEHREMICELARIYPDYFHVKIANLASHQVIQSLNPSDPDVVATAADWAAMTEAEREATNNLPSGYAKALLQFSFRDAPDIVYPGGFKYVICPLGSQAGSTSGRLAYLLAHSGAVVLLQMGSFAYHFSARLQPWVHYVPLSYTMADAAEKVEWLRTHDNVAKRIADNARVFGNSYLRQEDYYCYAAAALHTLSRIINGSDALQPFDAKLIKFKE